jgi:hypothetical protein
LNISTLNDPVPAPSAKPIVFGTALHALQIALIEFNLWRVPVYMRKFDEFGLTLPWLTQKMIRLSRWIIHDWSIIGPSLFALIAIDVVAIYLLGRYRRTAQSIWIAGIGILLFTIGIFMVAAVELPRIKLEEGLAR